MNGSILPFSSHMVSSAPVTGLSSSAVLQPMLSGQALMSALQEPESRRTSRTSDMTTGTVPKYRLQHQGMKLIVCDNPRLEIIPFLLEQFVKVFHAGSCVAKYGRIDFRRCEDNLRVSASHIAIKAHCGTNAPGNDLHDRTCRKRACPPSLPAFPRHPHPAAATAEIPSSWSAQSGIPSHDEARSRTGFHPFQSSSLLTSHYLFLSVLSQYFYYL